MGFGLEEKWIGPGVYDDGGDDDDDDDVRDAEPAERLYKINNEIIGKLSPDEVQFYTKLRILSEDGKTNICDMDSMVVFGSCGLFCVPVIDGADTLACPNAYLGGLIFSQSWYFDRLEHEMPCHIALAVDVDVESRRQAFNFWQPKYRSITYGHLARGLRLSKRETCSEYACRRLRSSQQHSRTFCRLLLTGAGGFCQSLASISVNLDYGIFNKCIRSAKLDIN